MTVWDQAATDLKALAEAPSEPVPAVTVANAESLLEKFRDRHACPAVTRSFWPTVCLSWLDGPEIEVFDDHIEIWPPGGQPADLWYENDFKPEAPLSHALLKVLPPA